METQAQRDQYKRLRDEARGRFGVENFQAEVVAHFGGVPKTPEEWVGAAEAFVAHKKSNVRDFSDEWE